MKRITNKELEQCLGKYHVDFSQFRDSDISIRNLNRLGINWKKIFEKYGIKRQNISFERGNDIYENYNIPYNNYVCIIIELCFEMDNNSIHYCPKCNKKLIGKINYCIYCGCKLYKKNIKK